MNEFLCLELRLKTEIDHINIIRMINVYDEKRQLIISIQNKIQDRQKLKHKKYFTTTQKQKRPSTISSDCLKNSQISADLFKYTNKLIVIIIVIWKYSAFIQCIVPK